MRKSGIRGRTALSFLLLFLLLFSHAAQAAPALLLPEASGTEVYERNGTVVDASHTDQGYIMVMHEGSDKKLALRITGGDEVFDYFLNNEGQFEVFPLQAGNGAYKIQLFENLKSSNYTLIYAKDIRVELKEENLPYLYPNQYVNFGMDSAAVPLSYELCEGLVTDKEKADTIFEYLKGNILYDYMRAMQVTSKTITSYVPDIEDTIARKMGICFDYAALMAGLLRIQGIPTKLIIGYADNNYHAWNSVLIDGQWVRYDPTSAAIGVTVEYYTQERWY